MHWPVRVFYCTFTTLLRSGTGHCVGSRFHSLACSVYRDALLSYGVLETVLSHALLFCRVTPCSLWELPPCLLLCWNPPYCRGPGSGCRPSHPSEVCDAAGFRQRQDVGFRDDRERRAPPGFSSHRGACVVQTFKSPGAQAHVCPHRDTYIHNHHQHFLAWSVLNLIWREIEPLQRSVGRAMLDNVKTILGWSML